MIWCDQTLNEGLRNGMDKGKITYLVQLLQTLGVACFDIDLTHGQKYNVPIITGVSREQMRGKVNACVADVRQAHQLGFVSIIISCSPQMEAMVWDELCAALSVAQQLQMKIAVSVENAPAFSVNAIEKLWKNLVPRGVETFIYSDGDSQLDPLAAADIITELVKKLPVTLEFHGHNACGLATANTLAAVNGGVKGIATTVAGIGVYGHAALEEMIMADKWLLGLETCETANLATICSHILSAMAVVVPRTKAIIGQDIFAHESGIHVDGVLKNPEIYEAFPPEEVGLTRKLVIGKHSGMASLQAKFTQWNIILSALEAQCLLKKVRKLAVEQHGAVSDEALWQLHKVAQIQ